MADRIQRDGWYQFDAARLVLSVIVVVAHWVEIFLWPYGLVGLSSYLLFRKLAWWAVVAFFLLSGLVIGRSLQARRRISRLVIVDFLRARFRRIYPTLLASVTLCTSIGLLLLWSGKTIYAGSALHPSRTEYSYLHHLPEVVASILRFGFSEPGVMSGNSNGPLWSLALEMQCYVIVGLAFQYCVARSAALRVACLLPLLLIALWLYRLAAGGMLGVTYFGVFLVGFTASFMDIRLPCLIRPLPRDFSYSLYVLHFPIMLGFFFFFLQGAPSVARVLLTGGAALAAVAVTSFACGVYIEDRWRRPRVGQTRDPVRGDSQPHDHGVLGFQRSSGG